MRHTWESLENRTKRNDSLQRIVLHITSQDTKERRPCIHYSYRSLCPGDNSSAYIGALLICNKQDETLVKKNKK